MGFIFFFFQPPHSPKLPTAFLFRSFRNEGFRFQLLRLKIDRLKVSRKLTRNASVEFKKLLHRCGINFNNQNLVGSLRHLDEYHSGNTYFLPCIASISCQNYGELSSKVIFLNNQTQNSTNLPSAVISFKVSVHKFFFLNCHSKLSTFHRRLVLTSLAF